MRRLEGSHMKDKLNKLYNLIFHSAKIYKQLIVFTVVVSIVPVILISVMLFKQINSMITDDLQKSRRQLVAQYMSNMEYKFHEYELSLKQIANNTIIINTLHGESESTNPYRNGRKVSEELSKSLTVENHKELYNCMIYSYLEGISIYGSKVTTMEGASNETWYLSHKALDEDFFIYPSYDKKSNILSLIQNIVYINTNTFENKMVGFIKLDIYAKQMFSLSNSSREPYPYDMVVLDQENNIVYSSNSSYNDILAKVPYDKIQDKNVVYYKKTVVYGDEISNYGLKFVFLFNNSQLGMKKAEIRKTLLPIILITAFIIIAIALVFTKGFSGRVAVLVHKMKAAETGDLTIGEEIGGNDEIAILDKQFNQMLYKLDNLIKKNYIQQLENKKTELRNLQLQINPHFLYNTLETISSIAAVNNVPTIVEICEKLGNIFRYSIGKNYGEFVTVKQELEHVQNYVYIQKIRFGNKFEAFYYVEPGTEERKILRFILQPIVENAIVHGIKGIPGQGTVEISITQDNNTLVITVEDDGVGMSEQKVEELTEYINKEKTDSSREDNSLGIGIRNVNQRIKLACGNEYGIIIKSSEDQGTCFTIVMPLISGGNS